MPWLVRVEIEFMMVLSCPPPGMPVETKTPANLPTKARFHQRSSVPSQKVCQKCSAGSARRARQSGGSDHARYLTFHSAGKFPKRVGIPNRNASKFTSSFGVMVGYAVTVVPGILDTGSALRLITGHSGRGLGERRSYW